MALDRNGIEILDEEECRRLLASQALGRVGLTVEALPVILPVNYAMLDGDVVFRSTSGAKLSAALDEAVVCFEIDGWDTPAHDGWSVLVTGRAQLIEDPVERKLADELPLAPWSGIRDGYAVRIRTTMVSGRRIGLQTHALPRDGELVALPAGDGRHASNGHG